MNTSRLSVAPKTTILLADIEKENFVWENALGELIDNSLDAGASRITVEVNKKERRVEVTDDGMGCHEPERMLISGDSIKRRGARTLGRYGVGLKHASYYFARLDGKTEIVTGSGDQFWSIRVKWQEIVDSGRWEIDAPQELTLDEVRMLSEGRGTKITFQMGKGRGFLAKDQWDKMLNTLAFMFSPALRAGRQIRFTSPGARPFTLPLQRDPVWSEQIEFELEIDGRRAHVRAGILAPDDKSGRRGMSYGFAHRIILPDSQEGCGSYSTEGFAGFVDLDQHWQLGQNKSQVTDEAWQQLINQIEANLRPLLEKLKNTAHQMQSEALRHQAASMLNRGMSDGFGEPKRPNKRGKKRAPQETSLVREVANATVVAGQGSVRGRKRQGGISLQWETRPDSSHAARVDPNGFCVYLNRANAGIAKAEAAGDWQLLGVIAAAHLYSSEAKNSLYGPQQFADLMGQLLGSALTITPVVAASA